MLIAERLKSWRLKNEMTMQAMSSLTGIDQALISKYENGKRLPSEKHLLQLSTGMNIPLNSMRNDYLTDKIVQLIQFNPQKENILEKASQRIQKHPTFQTTADLTVTNKNVNQHLIKLIPRQKKWLKLLPLSNNQLEILQLNINLAFVFDCNRLIGNSLSFKETSQIINQNKTITGKSFDEHLQAVNLNQTLLWMRQEANHPSIFNKKLVTTAHLLLYNGIANNNAGSYRTQNLTQNTPPAFLVERLMDDFFHTFLLQQYHLHPVILATHVFERIRSISPFADGNEQLALLMMNFILLKHNYPLTTLGSDLQTSLTLNNALEKAQSDNTNEDLALFIIDKIKAAYKQHFKLLA